MEDLELKEVYEKVELTGYTVKEVVKDMLTSRYGNEAPIEVVFKHREYCIADNSNDTNFKLEYSFYLEDNSGKFNHVGATIFCKKLSRPVLNEYLKSMQASIYKLLIFGKEYNNDVIVIKDIRNLNIE